MVTELVDRLWAVEPDDLTRQDAENQAVRRVGLDVQRRLAHKSNMLKQPMRDLMASAEDGGPVTKSLLALQDKVAEINPNNVNFNISGLRRLLAKLPFVGMPLTDWIARYQSVEGVIDTIAHDLREGRQRLERDNITLSEDQREMHSLILELHQYIAFSRAAETRISQKLADDAGMSPVKRKFLEEEVVFSLRQRILDLQQQLAVNQQGVLTTEVVIRNNRELIRGVERALNVTITALQTAATFALAAHSQQKVLAGVKAVTDTTNELISRTAEQLKTQGVEIHRQSSSTMLDIQTLNQAFSNVLSAIDDISRFRREALPQMAHSVLEMDGLTKSMEKAIQQQMGRSGAGNLLDIRLEGEKT